MLKKWLAGVLLCAFAVPFASAQSSSSCARHTRKFHNPWSWIKPTCDDGYKDERDHWYKNPRTWVGFGIIAASSFADGYTTSQQPSYLVESNPLLGSRPSTRTIVLASSAEFGVLATCHYLFFSWSHGHHSDHVESTFAAWAMPTIAIAVPGRNAIHNYRLETK